MKPEFLAKMMQLELQLHQGEHGRSHPHHRDPAPDQRSGDAIAGWESTSLQAFMAGADRMGPGCTNFLPKDAMNSSTLPSTTRRVHCADHLGQAVPDLRHHLHQITYPRRAYRARHSWTAGWSAAATTADAQRRDRAKLKSVLRRQGRPPDAAAARLQSFHQ